MSKDNLTDADVARAVAGDRDALEHALHAIEPELKSGLTIQPLWRRSLDPADVLQVSFVEAFLRIASLKNATVPGFRAWMRRLVQNNLSDAIRGLERDKRPDARQRITHGAAGESARTLLGLLVGDAATAGVRASAQEESAALHAAIDRLPPSYRTVVREVDLAERTVAEVAETMGRTPGAVHLLRSRAHARLRELLIRRE